MIQLNIEKTLKKKISTNLLCDVWKNTRQHYIRHHPEHHVRRMGWASYDKSVRNIIWDHFTKYAELI